jgi:hypothetical protein
VRALDSNQGLAPPKGSCWQFAKTLFGASRMMDVVMVALAIGFCALSIAYVYVCEQL